MQVHFSYHNVPRTEQIDRVIQKNLRKLERLLSHFAPDLVHLHGTLESNGTHKNTVVSLNLALPTGQLHSREQDASLLKDLQSCFDQIVAQLKKHKEALRREESWRRERPKRAAAGRSRP
ncbi:MAG TPA: HPF/RaiA family ribosome-associated protein [Terriglobia bacterium]|nr:HPF/RaiA family ribosome-associated protein [Terriglobia bacterium]